MNDDETRVMSRALTRGATMLDDACDDCGNPLFKYQGEVFCPVCQERRSDSGGTGETELSETTDAGTETDRSTEETDDAVSTEEDAVSETEAAVDGEDVEKHLRVLARRLARDAAERADDPDAVQRRLDALERTLDLLR